MVELPQDGQATVQMLYATNHDGPTFHTRSRTAQSNTTDNLTLCPKTDTATPDLTNATDMLDAMPKLLTVDRLQALHQMQSTDPFCRHISKYLSNSRASKYEVDLFLHMNGLFYKHVTNSNQKFLALVIPKIIEIHSACGST